MQSHTYDLWFIMGEVTMAIHDWGAKNMCLTENGLKWITLYTNGIYELSCQCNKFLEFLMTHDNCHGCLDLCCGAYLGSYLHLLNSIINITTKLIDKD